MEFSPFSEVAYFVQIPQRKQLFFIQIACIKVGALVFCLFQTLCAAPFCNVFVVSGEQHRRHLPSCHTAGRVYWGYSSSPPKWLSSSKHRFSGRTPGTIRAMVSTSTSAGQLAAGEDIVPDGDLLVHDLVQDALVYTFIMPAKHENMRHHGQFQRALLIPAPFPWGTYRSHRALCRYPGRPPHSSGRWGRLHDHASAAAVRHIIHTAVLVPGYSPGYSSSGQRYARLFWLCR